MKHKILSLVLCGCLVAGMFPAMALADDAQPVDTSTDTPSVTAEEVATSGTCGENLTWEYDEATKALTISGTGTMTDYRDWHFAENYNNIAPWIGLPFTSVVVEPGVTSIGDYAFYDCTSLTSISLPDGLTSIEESAFRDCTNLASVIIPDSVTFIGTSAFWGCTSLTSVTFPDGLASIGENAFSGCTSLTSVTLPDGLTSIGGSAFSGCTSLTNISLPDGLVSIGVYAFSGCTGLTNVTLPDGLASIGGYAFYDCTNLTSISLPDGLTSIGENAFWDCTNLTSISLPDGLTSIGDLAFWGCTSLTSIELPQHIESISYGTFSDCSALQSITIPNGVTFIGMDAFSGCEALEDVTFLGTVEQWYNVNIYSGNDNLWEDVACQGGGTAPAQITGTASVSNYCDLTWTGEIATGKLTINGTGAISIEAPGDYWTERPQTQFSATTVEIGSGITAIDGLWRSTSMTSISLPNTLTAIGDEALKQCTGLTELTIPNSVTEIGYGAFQDCTSLGEITLPASLTAIEHDTFTGCAALKTLNFTGTQAQWDALMDTDVDTGLGDTVNVVVNYVPETPDTETPDTETPDTETPDTETPDTETPDTETPAVQNKVEATVSGNKAEATVGGVALTLDNAGKVFESGTVITVEKVTQGQTYETVKKALAQAGATMDGAAVLEFTATKDEKPVQPNGPLSVTFSIPEGLTASNLKLFYVSPDGKYEEVKITVDPDARTVTANLTHFSTYVLANVAPTSGDSEVPQTGDGSQLSLYVAVLAVAVVALAAMSVKKRKA